MTIVTPAAPLAALIDTRAADAEAIIKGQLSDVLGQAHAFVSSLTRSKAPAVRAVLRSPTWPAADVHALRKTTAEIARLVGGLESGRYNLVAWTREGSSDAPTIGVAKKGAIKANTLGLWPLLPVLVIVAAGAALAGAWILADLYLAAKLADAQARKVQAEADARFLDAIRTARTEEDRASLTTAYQAAKAAAGATPPGWITKAGQSLANLASDVVNAEGAIARNFVEDAWPLLVMMLVMLMSQPKGTRS